MIVYNPKLISIWIKYITEIQCKVIKSFDHHFDNYWERSHSSQVDVFNIDSNMFSPELKKGMKNL